MNDGSQYDQDYFMRGKETGKSLYSCYRWLPELTVPMAAAIVGHCRISTAHTILDFGCARGYTVKALRELGYNAYGYDVSEWAIANCDPDVRDFVTDKPHKSEPARLMDVDWIIAKDVLEHVHHVSYSIPELMRAARVGLLVVVPLSVRDGDRYVVPEYDQDITHIHRWSLSTWAEAFMRPGWSVEARYRLPGVKDNYAQFEFGNGFITARRIE